MQRFDRGRPRDGGPLFELPKDGNEKVRGRTSTPSLVGPETSSPIDASSSSENSIDLLPHVRASGIAAVIEQKARKFAFKAWGYASDVDDQYSVKSSSLHVPVDKTGPKPRPYSRGLVFDRSSSVGSESRSRRAAEALQADDVASALSSLRNWKQKDVTSEEVAWFSKDHKPLKLPELVGDNKVHVEYRDSSRSWDSHGARLERTHSENVIDSAIVSSSPGNEDFVEIKKRGSLPRIRVSSETPERLEGCDDDIHTYGARLERTHSENVIDSAIVSSSAGNVDLVEIKERGSLPRSRASNSSETPEHLEGCDGEPLHLPSLELQKLVAEIEICTQDNAGLDEEVRTEEEIVAERALGSYKPRKTLDITQEITHNRRLLEMQEKLESLGSRLQKVKGDVASVQHIISDFHRMRCRCWCCRGYCRLHKSCSLLRDIAPALKDRWIPKLRRSRETRTDRAERRGRRPSKVNLCCVY
ncbi:hypothetical protein R1flu_001938 [Riccia fluitans]|uniref:Uncharacterized protein n=1 Tax=Riccia fluitans TaxID=41844 RepID=A0ABD1Y4P5_9MARC